MTEADYIDVSNLARLRVLQSALQWLLPRNEAERGYLTRIAQTIQHWEAELEKTLDGKVK